MNFPNNVLTEVRSFIYHNKNVLMMEIDDKLPNCIKFNVSELIHFEIHVDLISQQANPSKKNEGEIILSIHSENEHLMPYIKELNEYLVENGIFDTLNRVHKICKKIFVKLERTVDALDKTNKLNDKIDNGMVKTIHDDIDDDDIWVDERSPTFGSDYFDVDSFVKSTETNDSNELDTSSVTIDNFETNVELFKAFEYGFDSTEFEFDAKNRNNSEIPDVTEDDLSKINPYLYIKKKKSSTVTTVTFKNGIYCGQVNKHNKRCGIGLMIYNNGSKYNGNFINNERSGYGIFERRKNGDKYMGDWLNGKRWGSGKFWKIATKEYYNGSFKNDRYHGHGNLIFGDGQKYEGYFKNGLISGRGKYSWLSGHYKGDFYDGMWFKNKRCGYGVYSFSNGSMYVGQWKNDIKEGFGLFTFRNGDSYEGQWKNDLYHGRGCFKFDNGHCHYGIFQKGELYCMFKQWEKEEFMEEIAAEKKKRKNEDLEKKVQMLMKKVELYESVDADNTTPRTPRANITIVKNDVHIGIGAWEKLEIIGKGGFGLVWKCLQIETGRLMAGKKIDLFRNVKVIKKEIDYLKLMKHENIISYLGYEERKTVFFIFTELASEGTIKQYFKAHFNSIRSRVAAARVYFKQVVNGLKYLHSMNLFHRDIKPSNILVDRGVVKICDFGSAKAVTTVDKVDPNSNTMGTKPYLSPEFIIHGRSKQLNAAAIDIWALGISFLELVFLKYPFEVNENDEIGFQLLSFISSLKCPPKQINKIPNENLQDLIRSCLQIDVKKRATIDSLLEHKFFKEKTNCIKKYDSDEEKKKIEQNENVGEVDSDEFVDEWDEFSNMKTPDSANDQ